MKDRVNSDTDLLRRGREVSVTFLVGVGDDEYLVTIDEGRIKSISTGPVLMRQFAFSLRASAETWATFWQSVPPPGYHDLFALARFDRLKIEGDLRPFMRNLLYFKGMMASLRIGRPQ